MTSFLNVETSLTGRRWIGPSSEIERHAAAIAQQTGVSELLGRVLARRNVSIDGATAFLAPSLRDLMPDPSSLLDMDAAAERFIHAIQNNQRIAIFADYDVDGATSATLLIDWLRAKGKNATLYIPDRIDEGYGPNIPAMEALATNHDLIVCVDCGTLSHEPIASAIAKGADVIVLDHHLGGETLPPAHAVVNPNRQDETSDLTYLCAAGVVFLMLVAANRLLRIAGETCPDLLSMLDLVALGTVADVAPLQGLNRALVRQGLTVMAARKRPGMVALSDVAGMKSAPNTYHLGFLLGPRVNAGGRVGQADTGARLLATTDPAEAAKLAELLNHLNSERRAIEAEVLEAARAQAETRDVTGPLVWAAGDGWHPGVVGIVASRLKEAFNRPAVVIGTDGPEGKGSGRSVNGIDLGAAVAACTREGVLLKGGGHKMAAGLSIATDRIEEAMTRLSEMLDRQGASAIGPKDLTLDGLVTAGGATTDLITAVEAAGPFGAGAPAPRFAFAAMRIAFAKVAGENHLRLTLADDTGKLDAIAFNAFDSEIGHRLENHSGALFHVAGRLEIDHWGGRQKAKLRVEDVAEIL